MTEPAYRLDGRKVSRQDFYATACDPRRHVVIEACAGAGKTWLLVSRIVRALLEGTAPQEILAITFTRKAAGEMRTRLAEWLAGFAQLDAVQAAEELTQRGVSPAEAPQQAQALVALHERLLRHGRAVEVRTFHAWFSQLLQTAPLDLLTSLGLAPGMALIESIDDSLPELMRDFHAAVRADATLSDDFRALTLRHGRGLLRRWLEQALAQRAEVELADAAGTLAGAVEPGRPDLGEARVLDSEFVARARVLAGILGVHHTKAARAAAEKLTAALSHDRAAARYVALREALFTDEGKGTPRKLIKELPEQAALCAELDAIGEAILQFESHQDHEAMSRLARVLFSRYEALKQRHGFIDMGDLERVALAMLSDHELAGWVQQRLDARVRHLLIDEFQDTSPLQWHALHAWLSSYAGAGAGSEGPSLFIVGDPKQSIYRFRRAEPRVFEAAQRFVVDALGGTLAACDHTRRCSPGVLDVVNAVFGAMHADGVLPDWREHTTAVDEGASSVSPLRALPSAERARGKRDDGVDADASWRPSLTAPRREPEQVLRDIETGHVAAAIESLVKAEGVAPGEIMVLARKREPLREVAAALASRQLPFVESDDTRLGELPEAQDLLAVLDVLASPTQALSLARALKSPLFGAGDTALLWLATRARANGDWWDALQACVDDPSAAPALQRAATLLARWREASRSLPPHDLLDRIVHEGELMPRLIAAVPAALRGRAREAVHGLLAAALTLDGARFATLYGFVRALRRRRVDVPATVHPDAVRLLTIHGAKGLEAKVVVLIDADPETRRGDRATLLVDWPVASPRPRRVAFVASPARCPPSLRPLMTDEEAAAAREEVNTLYVALTRAEKGLLVSRTPPHAPGEGVSWWQRLEPLAMPWQPVLPPSAAVETVAPEVVVWPRVSASVSPSAVPAAQADEGAARLGRAVHRWLEWTSGDPMADAQSLAEAAARVFGVGDAAAVASIGRRILGQPSVRRFFDHAAIAWAGNEVPVASADGEPRRIDRLVRLAGSQGEWWVLDYKLAGAPQDDPALGQQLAAYRDAVAQLVPGERVRAAFITGRGELVEWPA